VPDPDEVLRLIDGADPDLGTFLRVAAVTGARRGELAALRWSDVDLVRATLAISRSVVGKNNDDALVVKSTKTGSQRTTALDPGTVDVLTRHRDRCKERASAAGVTLDDAFVFSPAAAGRRPWRPDGISLAFRRFRNEVGLRGVRLHDLRHAAATQMLAAGIPVRTVAGRLGHANATTTLNVYGHWLAASDQEAAVVLGDLLRENPSRSRRKGRGESSHASEAASSTPTSGDV
jgi:integrase